MNLDLGRSQWALIAVYALLAVGLSTCSGSLDDKSDEHFVCLTQADCLEGYVCTLRGEPYTYGVCLSVDELEPTPVENDCHDGLQSDVESDVDCGGPCAPCSTGQSCFASGDCSTDLCEAGACTVADVVTPPVPRANGEPCEQNAGCLSGYCGVLAGVSVCGEPCTAGACLAPNTECVDNFCLEITATCEPMGPGVFIGSACTCSQCLDAQRCVAATDVITCTCPLGFELADDALSCVDVDECAAGTFDCSPLGVCTNTLGTYLCACHTPYVGDGSLCECPTFDIFAGNDQVLPTAGSATLEAIALPPNGEGTWLVLSTLPPGLEQTGNFRDPHSPTSDFLGEPGVVYTLKWSVTNGCNTLTDTVVISFDACMGQHEFVDQRDGSGFRLLSLFGNCWMGRNVTLGTQLLTGSGSMPPTDDDILERYCYDDLQSNCLQLGGLYPHHEAAGYPLAAVAVTACPAGFSIPTSEQWATLGTNGYALLAPFADLPCTNDYGFSALLGGRFDSQLLYQDFAQHAYYWTSTCAGEVCDVFTISADGVVGTIPVETPISVSVRCVKSP